jgi:hypothetical protein
MGSEVLGQFAQGWNCEIISILAVSIRADGERKHIATSYMHGIPSLPIGWVSATVFSLAT